MANTIILNYEMLRRLELEFVKTIKFVCVFGKYGTEVFIVTKDDQVFAFGENKNGCLGLGLNKPVLKPTLVKELCDKKVIKFAFGLRHVIVITKNGEIYTFGYNEFGQLANGTTVDCYSPKLINDLVKKSIVEISCGAFHSLGLTKSGRIYSWGFNFWGQLGNRDNYNQLIATIVNGLDSEIIIAISCGHHNSLALTKSGYVYSWGHNGFGQLGIGTADRFQNIPIRVRVISDDIIINKIVCGQNHCLLLSSEGYIYSFGSNYYGQVGNGSKTDQNCPIKIDYANKFVDIATCVYSNTSIALSVSGQTLIWGKCAEECLTLPRETPLKTLQDLFARYNYATYKQLCLNKKPTIKERLISFKNGLKKRLMF